jgi:hypothetical protein
MAKLGKFIYISTPDAITQININITGYTKCVKKDFLEA